MKLLGYIPARKGSQRLKNKNFTPFYNNLSLTEIAILQAKKLKNMSGIVLDTDHKKFAEEIKKKHPNINIHIRNQEFAKHKSSIQQTLRNFYDTNNLNKNGNFTHTIILQPTSPLRKDTYINEAIEHFIENNMDLLVSASKAIIEPADLIKIDEEDRIMKLNFKKRENIYFETGQFYIIKNEYLFKSNNPFSIINKQNLFFTPMEHSIDIDNLSQFNIAKILYKQNPY
tara:strand:+ start:1 stop:684 length:684 start_codon:yes stop_codon:yes gene_type:complete